MDVPLLGKQVRISETCSEEECRGLCGTVMRLDLRSGVVMYSVEPYDQDDAAVEQFLFEENELILDEDPEDAGDGEDQNE